MKIPSNCFQPCNNLWHLKYSQGTGEMLGHEEHVLFLQKTWVPFSAPIRQLRTAYNSSSRGSDVVSASRHQAQMCYRQTCRWNTHTHEGRRGGGRGSSSLPNASLAHFLPKWRPKLLIESIPFWGTSLSTFFAKQATYRKSRDLL